MAVTAVNYGWAKRSGRSTVLTQSDEHFESWSGRKVRTGKDGSFRMNKPNEPFWVAELVDPNTRSPFAPAVYWNGHTRPLFEPVTSLDIHEALKFKDEAACWFAIEHLNTCKRGILIPTEHLIPPSARHTSMIMILYAFHQPHAAPYAYAYGPVDADLHMLRTTFFAEYPPLAPFPEFKNDEPWVAGSCSLALGKFTALTAA